MKRGDRIFIASVMVLGLLARLFRIGEQSLWVDEILTISVSDPDPGLNIWDYVKYNIHGPLHAFAVWAFGQVSHNDGWLRTPSAVAGTATIYFFFRWITVWLGGRIARVAALLLALHPLHLYYSQEVRNYACLVFFTTVASYYLHRLLSNESRRGFVRYTVMMVAAPLCNFSAAFIYAVHTWLYTVRRGFNKRRLLNWALVSIVILIAISPWIYRIYTFVDVTKLVTPVMPGEIESAQRLRGDTTFGAEVIPYAFYTFSVGFTLGPSLRELHHDAAIATVVRGWWPVLLWVAAWFGGLFVAGLVDLGRRRVLSGILLYLLVPLGFTLFLNWQNAKAFNARYILTTLPVFLCVIAAGIWSLPRVAARVAGAMTLLTLVISLGNYYFNGEYAREDVRGCVRFIETRAGADECVLVPTVTEVFEYYYDGSAHVHSLYAPMGTPRQRLDNQLGSVLTACADIWYIRARPWVNDPDDRVLATLNAVRTQAEVVTFDGVTAYLFKQ